jgi:hypothetical protein
MGMSHTGYKIVISIFAGGATCLPAMAQTPVPATPLPSPLIMNAHYEVDWSGIPIGRVNITSSEDASGYHMRVDTKTSGIAQLFSDERRVAEVTGHGGLGEPYLATRYESKPQKDTKGQSTLITYDAQGHIAAQQRIPGDDPAWRPPVPVEQADNAADSITAGFILRRMLYGALITHAPMVSTKTYDGARLAEMKLTVAHEHVNMPLMGKPADVVDVIVTRIPITGYTPKELKKFAKGDPEIHLYFTQDSAFLPVKVTVDSAFGEITGTMEQKD